ncbi:MAG TPA: hypothetical protein VFY39_10300, partial [Gammaproteobacteria bacterium]|nr:hypothetical protein [Gammaproteobacteria bacterium]
VGMHAYSIVSRRYSRRAGGLSSLFDKVSIAHHRVVLTRWAAAGLKVAIATAVLALADTTGQSMYLVLSHGGILRALSPGPIVAVVVWLFRQVALFRDQKGAPPVRFAKIPIGIAAGVPAVVLLLAIVTFWSFLAHLIAWQGQIPFTTRLAGPVTDSVIILLVASAGFVLLALASGWFSGFLNLSTLQTLYAARLTRAYLGASNGRRFYNDDDKGKGSANQEAERVAARSVAEPVRGDQVAQCDYYSTLAPLHVINVTLNQTIDPAEQLVQRDRKGKPMAVLPSGFSIDDLHYTFRTGGSIHSGEGSQRLTTGQWLATSGAAISTGLGRTTTLGTSIALGLANVRLGTWWSSGYGEDKSTGIERFFKQLFKTQTYLFYEMTAEFYGLRREWQYLSDGGHFENTGVYELLRPERGVRLIVLCDNGCDPDYEFNDLGNLIRLARIDFQLEIEVDEEICRRSDLGRDFGVAADFAHRAHGEAAHDKCALLLNVRRAERGMHSVRPHCRIILLKPTMLRSAPVDVQEYHSRNKTFPQQSTADQFFDEAQWESYRCLGLHIGRRVFADEAHGGNGEALWQYLREADEGTS